MGQCIGIDLGTTNSCVAVVEGQEPSVIHGADGSRTTPSMVAFDEAETTLIGALARRQAVTNPKRTFHGLKRLIGRRFESVEVCAIARAVPYPIVAAPNGDAWVHTAKKDYSPEELSALVLAAVKRDAEAYLGEEVSSAVITVPAYFDDRQRQSTKDAGELAGLGVRRIINEPTAAALAYGLKDGRQRQVAVFDLGGGTFDVSILEIDGNVIEVLATDGDTFLGGDDFDRRLVEYLLDDFKAKTSVDLADDPFALQRLREAAEQAKRELSTAATTAIDLPFVTTVDNEPKHLYSGQLPRALLEELVAEELARLDAPCERALAAAGLAATEIDDVLLVGGMTRMPAVEAKARQLFAGRRPSKNVNPDEVVAVGAAIQAASLTGELAQEIVLVDVTSHTVGLQVQGGGFSPLIAKNSTVPCREQKLFCPAEAGQDFVCFEVYQGESERVSGNTHLGRFTMSELGSQQTTGGEVHLEVSFTIDSDGLLNVTAVETATGKQASVEIQGAGGLSRQQVERLLAERESPLRNKPSRGPGPSPARADTDR